VERRNRDLLGQPIRCARFRSDLGRISAWVARRGLDELPFILNIVRGEMTWVGPKPEREEVVLRWHNLVPDYTRRFTVLPGVTGLAQVSGCPDSDAEGMIRRVHYDLFYVDNRSVILDLRTMGRTLGVLLRGRRAAQMPAGGAAAPEPMIGGVTR